MVNRSFRIITYPNAMLNKRSTEVDEVDEMLCQRVDRMWTTLYENGGVGLAGPQVGLMQRVVVIDVDPRGDHANKPNPGKRNPFTKSVMINPTIIDASNQLSEYEEGCLSVPGIHVNIARPKLITVRFFDLSMRAYEIEATGLLATCIQHEIDHLDGILMIDHTSLQEKAAIMGRINMKREKAYGR